MKIKIRLGGLNEAASLKGEDSSNKKGGLIEAALPNQ